MSDGEGLRSSNAPRKILRKKTRSLQLSSATQSTISAFLENDASGLSDSSFDFNMPSTTDSAGPTSSAPGTSTSVVAVLVPMSSGLSSSVAHLSPPAASSSVLVTSAELPGLGAPSVSISRRASIARLQSCSRPFSASSMEILPGSLVSVQDSSGQYDYHGGR
ncbi:hypothetical protein JG687_00008509 [Phytophthora cactorum]|uniref:Uncharacterized protein n=1 Tax=Phytophthora cactorum TaxID=29920 RepID=A0A8T1UC67_9STRA|nr:hypothetical protein JG687_00008509 [Phytophthora cactorum]